MTHARIIHGDCLEVLRGLPGGCVDAVVTDPPYHLPGGFMGASWDKAGVAFDPATWRAVLRVLKPSGYMLAFGGTRTYHRLTSAVEDAGFEIRDCLMWLHGQGFPKAKSCLKPAWEPILLARKPGPRVEPLGIDDCRVPASSGDVERARVPQPAFNSPTGKTYGMKCGEGRNGETHDMTAGRWPANCVLEAFAAFGERTSNSTGKGKVRGIGYGAAASGSFLPPRPTDAGTAARFFYCAKASKADRGEGNGHPCVKPTSLMRWLVRLVSRPGDLIIDPFAGSGSTAKACGLEGRECLLIERDAGYVEIARRRLDAEVNKAGLFAAGAAP